MTDDLALTRYALTADTADARIDADTGRGEMTWLDGGRDGAVTTCAGPCGRPVRPRRTSIDDWPGTVEVRSLGMCSMCNKATGHWSAAVTDLIDVALTEAPAPVGGLCAEVGPDPFFSQRGGDKYTEARKLCAACHVFDECRAWVLKVESGQPKGFRAGLVAGMTPGERYKADPLTGQGAVA